MSNRKSSVNLKDNTATLLPMSVDVDLVRFEKNLLQIGFFGANDARDKSRTSRRVEQIVSRNGHKVRVAAEFRGSELLGLPSTADRDKFIALLKIISEDRARRGAITNPIRFSGYRLIQELGLSSNGEIYEEILRWGKRMTDTTITSESVVYIAAKKIYSDEVLHVFRSFKRTGSSRLDGAERQEQYEVVLEDWLLENLIQRYVIPEDFNAYKQLTRPTAKGIFGNLHLWFHASRGKPVEKDYAELCNLLSIQTYPHLSKIRSTIGLALEELVHIKYLATWDVQRMVSKDGFKLVLTPGEQLLRLLENTAGDRSLPHGKAEPGPAAQLTEKAASPQPASRPSSPEDEEAVRQLQAHGVLPAKAQQLIKMHGAEKVLDCVEYLETKLNGPGRSGIDNPAGLIIYSIENDLPIPAAFVSQRRAKQLQEDKKDDRRRQHLNQHAYRLWLEKKAIAAMEERYPGDQLNRELRSVISRHNRTDEAFRRVPETNKQIVARQILLQEVARELNFPTYEDWLTTHNQSQLFA